MQSSLLSYDVDKLRTLNILLAEDDLLNAKLLSIIFLQNDLNLQIAGNGSNCIKKLKTHHFDIILMDMEMPEMNGYEATVIIRQELKLSIPIIALTAHTRAGEREKCLELGINAHIMKPVNTELLFAAMSNLTSVSSHTTDNINPASLTAQPQIRGKVCSLNYLVDVTRGNKKALNNIISFFLQQTREELAALSNAIEKSDYNIISDIIHKLRSSFLILGISILQPVFEEMEYLGGIASDIKKIALLNQHVNMVFCRVLEEMKDRE